MVKYFKKWEFKDKSGVTYYVVDCTVAYKVSKERYDAIDCVELGEQIDFYDKDKDTHNIRYV